MDKEPDLEKIIEYMRKEGWAGGKPGPAKDPEFEIIYKRLREGGLEEYTKLEYPYTRTELEGSDNLVGNITLAANNEAEPIGLYKTVEYIHLYTSNITGDYKAEIKLKKPKDFEFKIFKEKIYIDVPSNFYMYNSKAFITNVREDNKYAYVKADLLVEQSLRLANTLDFINKNPNKVDLIADLNYN